ncbi:site-specific DNA-methyltransferase [Fusobacterium polymorphum]|uniref:site-specific DNA-methyltransferase n=2 Tax=Fusobacterium nucleatum subsp. polymorphum TaxID=76857 RepID=UPI00300820B4
MEKLDGTSMNLVQENIKKLKEIFPEIFIEGRIDFELLRQICHGGGVQDLENSKERYSLTWNGKSEARQIAQEVSTGTLRPAKEESKNWDNTENIYIEGDNLEVLKLLQKSYHGKIKMIYIDPPYNTGKDFVYKDNFKDNIENYKKVTGQVSEEGTKLTTNTDTDGRYHSNWLNMMYPRLKLARNLLTDDGVIFISIDDNEQANLKKLCDEIFGEENFVAQIVWERAYAPVNLKKHFSESHDYIICYSKNINLSINNGLKRSEEADNRYSNPDNDPRGIWKSGDLSVGPAIKEKVYEIITPSGRKILPPNGYCWRLDKEKFKEYVKENRIWFGRDGNNVPSIKRFLSEVKQNVTPMTIWKYTEVGHSQDATKKLKELFHEVHVFDYSKTVELIKRCIELYTVQDDIVLDFFSGSATTAHSIMQLNAEDGGDRKYIMVQLPELCDEDSEACKAGYKNICEIGKERIRRAGEKIKSDESLPLENREKLDVGFKVFKLDSSNIKEWDTDTENLQQSLLDSIENIKRDRNTLDVLYEILLKYGLDLNIPIEENKDFYSIGGGSLLVSLNKEINNEVINSICEKYKKLQEIDKEFKTTVILRDNSFKNDVDKTNAIKKLEQVGINEIRSI